MGIQGNSTGVLIMGVVVGSAAIAVISYYIARAMKGSLKLSLAQKSVSSGQQITGSLSVTTKKAMTADRMYIALVGEREVRERSRSGNGSSTKWVEFYRDEADILMDEQLPAGFSETYEFALDAPAEGQIQTGAGAAAAVAGAMGDAADSEVAKKIMNGVGQLASAVGSMNPSRKRWKVASRLETKGVDLAASQKIHVSLKSAV